MNHGVYHKPYRPRGASRWSAAGFMKKITGYPEFDMSYLAWKLDSRRWNPRIWRDENKRPGRYVPVSM